jgi:hypothetical protein
VRPRCLTGLAGLWAAVFALAGPAAADPSRLVVWAWERPEDLRFLPPDADIAVQSAFIEIRGPDLFTRARRFPLLARSGQVTTAVAHVQIRRHQAPVWSPALADRLAEAVVRLTAPSHPQRVQIDFEVRASQRQMLLDLVHAVRRRLPAGTILSMTALASWCDTESWLSAAEVDEIVPMLFRMGPGGEGLMQALTNGADFDQPVCRTALGIAADLPPGRAPAGRRVYLFNPRSWTAERFAEVRERVEAWGSGH